MGIREAVDEAGRRDRLVDPAARRDQAERPVAGRGALRGDQDVGRAPQWSSPNQRPVRPNPVITSSAMSSTP